MAETHCEFLKLLKIKSFSYSFLLGCFAGHPSFLLFYAIRYFCSIVEEMPDMTNEESEQLALKDLLDNVCIVLVHPLLPENIGSACRAMKNMGLSDLRLVHPPLDRTQRAEKLAHGAEEILENAKRVFTVEEALEGVQYTVGTTARLGGWREQVKTPRTAAPILLDLAKENRIAILFGSEDCGLSNEVVKECQMLINVPTTKEHHSLNLAQAVLLIAYELRLHGLGSEASPLKLADVRNVNGMFEELTEALELIDFLRPGKPDYWMLAFKRLFARSGLTEREVNMLRGVCRQIRWINSRRMDAEQKLTESDPIKE